MKVSFMFDKPTVLFTPLAKMKSDMLVDMWDKEVGWLGLVNRTENFTFKIEDIFVLDQEVTSVTTHLGANAWSELYLDLLDQGIISKETQDVKGLYMWGHSHHTMGVGPSGQDNTQVREFLQDFPPYMIRIIANKQGKMKIDLFLCDDGIIIEDVNYKIDIPSDAEVKAFLEQEIKNKVKPKVARVSKADWRKKNIDTRIKEPRHFPHGHEHLGFNVYDPYDTYEDEVARFDREYREFMDATGVTEEELSRGGPRNDFEEIAEAGTITRDRQDEQ